MRIIMAAAACCSATMGPAAWAQSATDDGAIRNIVADFAKSWNTPGMPGFEKLFAPNADFVVISGHWHKGRDDIVTYHRGMLGRGYKGSHLTAEKIDVRFVRPDVAVAHVAWHADYTSREGSPAVRTALMTIIVTKDEGRWEIAAAHNTLTGGPGYAFTRPPPK